MAIGVECPTPPQGERPGERGLGFQRPATARLALLFWVLVVVGLIERLVAAHASNLVIAHADEHQQYLEQANRQVHGDGLIFWEQVRGMRHLLYPDVLAILLRAQEAIGIYDPFTQATLLRGTIASLVFGVLTLQAWVWLRQERVEPALFLLFLNVASIEVIFIQVRLLSENAMAIPLVLGLILEARYPRLAGICWAIMFAVRFQSAFLILGFGLGTLIEDVRAFRSQRDAPPFRKTVLLTQGLMIGAFLVGAYDAWTNQGWFHSPLEYLKANILENLAADFGVQPWSTYFVEGTISLLLVSPLIVLLLLPVLRQESRLFLAAAFFVVGHSFVGHKEFRFMWGLAPLGMILLSLGFEAISKANRFAWLDSRRLMFLLCLSFLVLSLLRFPSVAWRTEPYRTTCLALRWLGERDDVEGVLMWPFHSWESGNCFYLRRPGVTLHYPSDLRDPAGIDLSHLLRGKINYVIAAKEAEADLAALPLIKVGEVDGASIYRVIDR